MNKPAKTTRLHLPIVPLPARAVRAHEFKNCLSVIKAVNRLIEPELSETSLSRVERSQAAVARMLALLAEELVEGGGASEALMFASVEDVVRAVVERAEDVAEAAGVQLVVHVGPGGVTGDAGDLAEALGNIVLNAIQATAAGGAVFIHTYDRPDGSQLWAVEDTGCGMSNEAMARLGSPGFSLRSGGSGLGLASARAIIGRHGGVTEVESKPGSGTLVTIWLPSEPPRADLLSRGCAAANNDNSRGD